MRAQSFSSNEIGLPPPSPVSGDLSRGKEEKIAERGGGLCAACDELISSNVAGTS